MIHNSRSVDHFCRAFFSSPNQLMKNHAPFIFTKILLSSGSEVIAFSCLHFTEIYTLLHTEKFNIFDRLMGGS